MEDSKLKTGKREAIIEAAIKVFSTKGYHNTRMEEIAATAGIGKGTIYEYFSSKLQLFQAMMENSLELYYDNFAQEERNLTFEEWVYFVTEAHFSFCLRNKELTRLIFWDTEIFDEELKEWVYNVRTEKEEHMCEIIEGAIKRGEIKVTDPRILTAIIAGILGSMWVPIVLEDWEIDPSVLARQVTDILMQGIKR